MHQPHMRPVEGTNMSTRHHVVISWSGAGTESKPLIEMLKKLNCSFTEIVEGDRTQLEITVESESMRGLRDAVDELLVQLSSLEDS